MKPQQCGSDPAGICAPKRKRLTKNFKSTVNACTDARLNRSIADYEFALASSRERIDEVSSGRRIAVTSRMAASRAGRRTGLLT
jgi:hypothetical protein